MSKVTNHVQCPEIDKELTPHTVNYFYLDVIKCIAIFFVIYYHTKVIDSDIISSPKTSTYINYFLTTILATCVPLFFFVNGFLLLNKPLLLKKHFSRLIKIPFLYFFWGLISYPIIYLSNNIPFTSRSIWNDFLQSKPGYTNHLWFLTAMLGIYILFPLIKLAFDNKIKYFHLFFTTLFVVVIGSRSLNQLLDIVSYSLNGFTNVTVLNLQYLLNKLSNTYLLSLLYFMIGGLTFKFKDRYIFSKITYFSIIFISMLLSFFYGLIMSVTSNELYDVVWNGYTTVPTLLTVFSLFYVLRFIEYKKNIFFNTIGLIGKNSLGIYLIHNIVIRITKDFYIGFATNNFITGFLYILIVLFISLYTSLLIKKIPFIKKVISL